MSTEYTMASVTLRDHIDAETEGDRSPIQVDPLAIAEQQLDEARWMKVMRMTARRFGELNPVERRNYARWARHLAKVLGEKADMFERNSTPEPELPAALQARG
jgi:hypothetical protein